MTASALGARVTHWCGRAAEALMYPGSVQVVVCAQTATSISAAHPPQAAR